ncbi:MAG: MBL fold metallo-hydrolase, partial [Streptomyces sp.]|nr:MBL fold metallo-hydrolase [Streptomyces sp.]
MLHPPTHARRHLPLHARSRHRLTGDALFAGGPGATGRSYVDLPTIGRSIGDRLLVLPPATDVRTGHGD